MVDCGQPTSQVVRLLVCCRASDPEPEALRRSRHCAYNSQRLIHRPLGAGYYCSLKTSVIHVVPSKNVGDENAVELGIFEQFGQFHPVLDVAKFVRVVLRMPP